VRLMAEKGDSETFFLFQVLWSSPVGILPPALRARLHVALTRKSNWRNLGIFQNQCPFGNRGTMAEGIFTSFLSG
jgi:hypothetical protein